MTETEVVTETEAAVTEVVVTDRAVTEVAVKEAMETQIVVIATEALAEVTKEKIAEEDAEISLQFYKA